MPAQPAEGAEGGRASRRPAGPRRRPAPTTLDTAWGFGYKHGLRSMNTRRPTLPGLRNAPRLRLSLSPRKAVQCLLAPLLAVHAAFPVLVGLACLLLSVFNPPATSLMLHRRLVEGYRIRPGRFVPLADVPRYAQLMFVRLEDNTFYAHPGVEPRALRDAWRANRELGFIYRGGSTIPMQLARTLFLTQERSYLRKYLEVLAALELDLLLSKRRILELYLNNIEFAPGVYGLGAAARWHFGKPAAGLERDEYRRLATIVASPLKYDLTTFLRRRALSERYRYLVYAFPDPGAEPAASLSGAGVEAGVVVPEAQVREALPQPPEQGADP